MGTYEDPCPYQDSMKGMQLMQFQIRYRNSKPNFSYLDEQLSFVLFYRQLNQPIVRWQLKRRKLYGKWIQVFCGHGKSESKKKYYKYWI